MWRPLSGILSDSKRSGVYFYPHYFFGTRWSVTGALGSVVRILEALIDENAHTRKSPAYVRLYSSLLYKPGLRDTRYP
jgi:hypothetical protein